MLSDFDVIVVGLGAMGSAAAYHLARAGKRVLGIDRFRPPHDRGSSHGRSRIIREAYFEHTSYVPLVRRAYELWADLERTSGRRLLVQTGGLMIGPPNGVVVSGAKKSAEDHKLPYELLSAPELRRRYPAFEPADDMVAVWEPRAGVLFPELAVQTMLELAAQAGATLRFDEPVLNWESQDGDPQVTTPSGSYRAPRLLLSLGAWVNSLTPDLQLPLSIERQVLCWFGPVSNPELFRPENCPIFLWEYGPERFFYGFPDLGDGIKAAFHHEGELCQPDSLPREVTEDEVQSLRSMLALYVPAAAGKLQSSAVCMYTNAPDGHFILGHHPASSQVVIASPCSGHGFKFAPVIGELAAQLLDHRKPTLDLSLFSPNRFSPLA